jgi:hypothetical protein
MSRFFGVLCLLFVTKLVFSLPRPNTNVTEDEMIQILEQHEISASEKCRDYNLAAWNYNTDVENAAKVGELVSTLQYVRLLPSLYVWKLPQMRYVRALFRRNTSVHTTRSGFLELPGSELRQFWWLRETFRIYIYLLPFLFTFQWWC